MEIEREKLTRTGLENDRITATIVLSTDGLAATSVAAVTSCKVACVYVV
jgi:hypothetical protein